MRYVKQDYICKTCFLILNPHLDSGDIMLDDSSFLGYDAVLVGNQNQVFWGSVVSSSSRVIKMTLRYLQTLGHIISQKNRNHSCTTVKTSKLDIVLIMRYIFSIPYTAIQTAVSQRRLFHLTYADIDGHEASLQIKLESSQAASGVYRAITEKHAFYSCETVRSAVTAQFIRDLKVLFICGLGFENVPDLYLL